MMHVWTITDSIGIIYGPFPWLLHVEKFIRQNALPEPLILTQVPNGAPGPIGKVVKDALLFGASIVDGDQNVERPEPQG